MKKADLNKRLEKAKTHFEKCSGIVEKLQAEAASLRYTCPILDVRLKKYKQRKFFLKQWITAHAAKPANSAECSKVEQAA